MQKEVLSDNVQKLIDNIKKATTKCGRSIDDIHIIAASKTQSIETIKDLDSLNIIHIMGENKVQEFVDKYTPLENSSWHFIGQLQTNKVKYIIDKVDLIHSVDRISLADTIDKQAKKAGKIQQILIEINMADEISKGGISIDNTSNFYYQLKEYENIQIVGLMTVMPQCSEGLLRHSFARLKETFDELKSIDSNISILSAGMSNDYEIAIEYGATHIRIGRAIFGERIYKIDDIKDQSEGNN